MARSVRRSNQRLGRIGRAVVEEVTQALRRGSIVIADTAAQKIIDPPKTGRIYPSRGRKGAKHQASAPGEPPAADVGRLHGSITTVDTSRPGTIEFEQGANTPYAAPLELGTANIEPRPYMGPSFDQNVGQIQASVRQAVRRGNRRR